MKSWKMRLGLVLTMMAMVLAVSIPAVADEEDRFEKRLERFEDRLDFFDFEEDFFLGEDFECEDFGDEDECDFEDFEDFVDDFDEEDLFVDNFFLEAESVEFFCGDDDGDGLVGEDVVDGIDGDLDGLVDEDEELVECDDLFALVEFDNDFDGFDFDGDGFDFDLD